MPGLLRGVARTAVVAGTASSVAGRVRRRQGQRWAAQDEAPPQQQQQAAPPPAPPTDRIKELKDLADLKSQGVLTEEEFAQQKARILA
jgi:hypothetical protein